MACGIRRPVSSPQQCRSPRNIAVGDVGAHPRTGAADEWGAIMTDLLARLNGVSRSGEGWTARCPAHEDQHNSLSVHNRNGRWLLKCHAGCGWEEIIGALGIDASA